MIHRVGLLKAPHSKLKMYDMLGNVWELVRDDWVNVNNPISSFNNKTNPIGCVKDRNGKFINSGSSTKVIKGGAFDQFCRKTISPSRQGIDKSSCQSASGGPANVGFRPSLVYTHEVKPKTFIPGQSQVDLFFLFDASASTSDQVGGMIDSARNIVQYFAANTDLTTAEKDKVCHVGSALFLGPQIRMMCSNFNTNTDSRCKSVLSAHERYYDAGTADAYEQHKRFMVNGNRDSANWSLLSGHRDLDRGYLCDSVNTAHNYFVSEFNNWKNRVHGEWTSRDIPPMDYFGNDQPEQRSREFDAGETIKPEDAQPSVKSTGLEDGGGSPETRDGASQRDSRGNDEGVGGTSAYEGLPGNCTYAYKVFNQVDLWAFFHKGVPAYKTDGNGGISFQNNVPFFTYDPRSYDGSFECPHVAGYPDFNCDHERESDWGTPEGIYGKGVLSNYYAGCEPVSEVLSTILGEGIFHGFPWNTSIGYSFRGNNIPRLVFVYTNEFDNSLVRSYYDRGWKTEDSHQRNVMLFPRMESDTTIRFYPVVEYSQEGEKSTPPDNSCIQFYYDYNGKSGSPNPMYQFFSKIGLVRDVSTLIEGVNGIYNGGFVPAYPRLTIWSPDGQVYPDYSCTPNTYSGYVPVVGNAFLPNFDLRRDGWYGIWYKWSDIWKLITPEQMQAAQYKPDHSFNGWWFDY